MTIEAELLAEHRRAAHAVMTLLLAGDRDGACVMVNEIGDNPAGFVSILALCLGDLALGIHQYWAREMVRAGFEFTDMHPSQVGDPVAIADVAWRTFVTQWEAQQ